MLHTVFSQNIPLSFQTIAEGNKKQNGQRAVHFCGLAQFVERMYELLQAAQEVSVMKNHSAPWRGATIFFLFIQRTQRNC